MVCARVVLERDEDRSALLGRIKKHCRTRFPEYKVPMKLVVSTERQHSLRHKKIRTGPATGGAASPLR